MAKSLGSSPTPKNTWRVALKGRREVCGMRYAEWRLCWGRCQNNTDLRDVYTCRKKQVATVRWCWRKQEPVSDRWAEGVPCFWDRRGAVWSAGWVLHLRLESHSVCMQATLTCCSHFVCFCLGHLCFLAVGSMTRILQADDCSSRLLWLILRPKAADVTLWMFLSPT